LVPTEEQYYACVREVLELCARLGVQVYIKEHLQQHLTESERATNKLMMRMPHFKPIR
jgi:hypothetical protein